MVDERSSEVNADNETEMLRRYAEHTLDIPMSSVRMLAAPVINRSGPLPHGVHHGLVVTLINQAIVSAETLAAWVYCFQNRGGEAPSFFKALMTYHAGFPRELWDQISVGGWHRSALGLPDPAELDKAYESARALLEAEPNAGTPTVVRGLDLSWENFDSVITETASNISNDSNKFYRMGMKSKHGMSFMWSYVKDHGSSLCFVDGKTLDIWSVPVSPHFASTLLQFSTNALTAAQKLASTAWVLAEAGELYLKESSPSNS